ncbi:hypothetical protein JCM8208_002151 [Rhodotorula glutinis]
MSGELHVLPPSSPAGSSSSPRVHKAPAALADNDDDESSWDSADSDDSSPPVKGTLWNEELDAILIKGMALLPAMGRRAVSLETDGQSMGRNGLLSEYLRRQTGKYRNRTQISSHICTLVKNNPGNTRLKQLYVGHKLSPSTFADTKWSALLGPDRFPHTYASAKAANDMMKRAQIKAAAAHRARRGETGTAGTTVRKRKRSRTGALSGGGGGSAGQRAGRKDVQQGARTKENAPGPSPRRKKARRALDSPRSGLPPFLSTSSAPPSLADSTLSAFLTGLNPSLVPLAPHLVAAGVDSVDALAKLAQFEPWTLALVLEGVRERAETLVSVVQLRLFGLRLEEAGRALRGGG